jgi:hypothetical protein
VTTATDAKFFAAARTIAGPPMSICSTHSSAWRPTRRLGERVEVADEQVERRDAEVVELGNVRRLSQVGQQPGVHLRVQGLHPAVEALGEAGQLLDRRDRGAGGRDARGRRAGGHDLHAGGRQGADEVVEAGLVVHAHQRAPDRSPIHRRSSPSPIDGPSGADHPPHVLNELPPFRVLDPLGERVLGVVVEHRDGHLRDDRAGVDARVDEVQRRPGHLDAVRQRVARAVNTGNAGSSALCVFTYLPPKRSRNAAPTSFMNPAETIRSGSYRHTPR